MQTKNIADVAKWIPALAVFIGVATAQAESADRTDEHKAAIASIEHFNQVQREAGMPEMPIPSSEEWLKAEQEGEAKAAESTAILDSAGPPVLAEAAGSAPLAVGAEAMMVSSNGIDVVWPSTPGKTYEVARMDDLLQPNQTILASGFPASTSNTTIFTDTTAGSAALRLYATAETGIRIALPESNCYHGVVSLPLELGIPSSINPVGISLTLDDAPSPAITPPEFPFQQGTRATWDTTLVSNGWHTLRAFLEYPISQIDNRGGYDEYLSDGVHVFVDNPITLAELPMTWGSALPIRASFRTPEASWTVEIRSPSNELVRAFSGGTTTGEIDLQWDGKDTNGISFSGDYIQFDISTVSTTEVADSCGAGVYGMQSGLVIVTNRHGRRIYRESPIPPFPHEFLVSYQLLFNPASIGGIEFNSMIENIAALIQGSGHYSLGGDGTGIFGTTRIYDTTSSWNAWRNSLRSSPTPRNLYYFGHGSKSSIGTDPSAGLGWTAERIAEFLGNGRIQDFPSVAHAYRFVFLDGCNTGNGRLCESFGIERRKVTTPEYTQRGLVPRAFVGWKDVKAFAAFFGGISFNNLHGNFIRAFFIDWSDGDREVVDSITASLPVGFSAPTIWGDETLRW